MEQFCNIASLFYCLTNLLYAKLLLSTYWNACVAEKRAAVAIVAGTCGAPAAIEVEALAEQRERTERETAGDEHERAEEVAQT